MSPPHGSGRSTDPAEAIGLGHARSRTDEPTATAPERPLGPEGGQTHPWHPAIEPEFALDAHGVPRSRYSRELGDRPAHPLAHALAGRLIELYVPPQHRSGPPWKANMPYTLCTHDSMHRCHTAFRYDRAFPVQAIHDRGLWLRQVLGTQGVHPVYSDETEHCRLFLDVDVTGEGGATFRELPMAERRRVVRAVTFAAGRVLGDAAIHVLDSGWGGFWLQCWFDEPGTPEDLGHVLNALRNRIWFTCQVVGLSVLPGNRRWSWPHLTLDVDPLSANGCRTWASPNGPEHALWIDPDTALPLPDQHAHTMSIEPTGSLARLAEGLRTGRAGPSTPWQGVIYEPRDQRRLGWRDLEDDLWYHALELRYDVPVWEMTWLHDDLPRTRGRDEWLLHHPDWVPWVGLWDERSLERLEHDPSRARREAIEAREKWIADAPARAARLEELRVIHEEHLRWQRRTANEVAVGKAVRQELHRRYQKSDPAAVAVLTEALADQFGDDEFDSRRVDWDGIDWEALRPPIVPLDESLAAYLASLDREGPWPDEPMPAAPTSAWKSAPAVEHGMAVPPLGPPPPPEAEVQDGDDGTTGAGVGAKDPADDEPIDTWDEDDEESTAAIESALDSPLDGDDLIEAVVHAAIRETVPPGQTNAWLVEEDNLLGRIVAALVEAGGISRRGVMGEADRDALVRAVMARCDSSEDEVELESDVYHKVGWYLRLLEEGRFRSPLRGRRRRLPPEDLEAIESLASTYCRLVSRQDPSRVSAALTQLLWCHRSSADGLVRITLGELSRRILLHHGERAGVRWLSRFVGGIAEGWAEGGTPPVLPLLRTVRKGDRREPDADGNTWSVFEAIGDAWHPEGD